MSTSVTATFVFTDLVDSTATSARLGPEAAEELRQTHFRLLRSAAAASGGTEVKNLGDGLMVMNSSPSRALAGAVGMQQAIERHNRSADEPLGVRIGMSTGEVVEEEGDYFGDPVVEAARLCAAAQGGQILVTELLRMMVGRHATQTFVPLGPLTLKGLPEPVDVAEVVWEPVAVAGSVPLPGRLVGAASNALFGFFGRRDELAVLEAARKEAAASERCQAVFVAGEAGMGKTSLIAQSTRAAHAEGSAVFFGHSDEDLGVAYQPWIEVLSSVVRDVDPEVLAGLRSTQRGALSRLVPDIGGDGDRVADPDTERLLLLEGVVELLAAVSKREPVMVVLDDLHWADTASLQLLRHVIASSSSMRATITITYRDTDLGRGDPLTQLLADLHREANVTRVALRGLDDTDLVELLAAAAGHDLDDDGVDLAHALRRETEGNPFFTGEILRHLGESGGIVLDDTGRWVLAGELDEIGLPTSVRDVVGRRVERLGDEALRVLTLAAVIGREFDLDVLATLADTNEDSLLDAMDAAVGAALLVESDVPGCYRFAHALTQHTLYDELSPTRRERAHRLVAEALEDRSGAQDAATLAELAHHWVAATRPSDLGKAIDYVRRAGDAARDALAPDDAARWYQQALEMLGRNTKTEPRLQVDLLVALGQAQWAAGQQDYRSALVDAFELAKQSGDDELVIEAGLGFGVYRGGVTGDAVANEPLAAALDRLGPAPTALRARCLAALAESYDSTAQADQRRARALEAVEVARLAGDDGAFLDVITSVYTALGTPDLRDEVLADLERVVVIADRVGDPMQRAMAWYREVWAHYQRADLDAADHRLEELERLADDIGLPVTAYELGLLQTGRLLLAGDADGAEARNEAMLEVGLAAGIADVLGAYGGFLYAICEHRGTQNEIAEFFLQAAVDNPAIAALRSAATVMLAELGDVQQASERLEADAAAEFGGYPYDSLWTATMVNLTDASVLTRNVVAAEQLVERLRPYAEHVISPAGPIVNGVIARPLARAATLLGDYERAEEWFAIAHDMHERLRAPFWQARAQLDHADLCVVRGAEGDLDRARELIATAATTAAQYGCGGLTRRADALLAQL